MKDIYVSAYNPEYPTLGSRGYIQTILHILPSYLLVFIFIKNFKLKMILIISYVIIIVGLLLFLKTIQNILNGNLKSLYDKRCIQNDKNLLIYSFYSLVLINRIQKER